jgi:rfaE bifunctional protein nucleotidyltransferase chain/domain
MMNITSKIVDTNYLLPEDKKIIFTNGCFDIIHRGHIEYLYKAKQTGDILIVGLNSDISVRRLKGEKRPINDEYARAIVLAALYFVDYVIIFNEDTPLNLIKHIKPHILVKGGDYKVEDIVGNKFVKEYGGDVIILPLVMGYSTTNIIINNCSF